MFTSSSEAIASVAGSADFAQAPAISPSASRLPLGLPVRLSRDENALAELLRHPAISRRGSATRIAANVQPTGIA